MTLLEAHLSLPLVHWSRGSKKQPISWCPAGYYNFLKTGIVSCGDLYNPGGKMLWQRICRIFSAVLCDHNFQNFQNANPVLCWVA